MYGDLVMRFLTTILEITSIEKIWSGLNFRICLTCVLAAGLLWSSCTKTPSSISSDVLNPRIDFIQPTQGEAGTHVSIHGGVYSIVTEENEVFFNHKPATVLSGTDSTMIAVVPDSAGSGPVTIRIQGRPGIDSVNFTYVIPAVTITKITPDQALPGDTVVVDGMNFDPSAQNDKVLFGSTADASVLQASSTQLTVVVPDGSGNVYVTVTTNGKPSNAVPFTYLVPAPAITSISPQTGAAGTIVTITGNNFSATPSEDTVRINGIQADVTAASTTQLIASVPGNATSGSVTVTVNGQTSNGIMFRVCFDISSYSAACGIWGDQIRINGCLGNNVSQVVFLDTYPVQPSSVNINNYLTVTVPQTTAFTDIGQAYPIRILDTNGNRVSGPDFTIISPFRTDSADVRLAPTNLATYYNLTIYGAFTGYSDHFQLVNVYVNGTQLTSTGNNLIINETNITATLPTSMINPDVVNTAEVKIACKSQSVTIKLK